MLLTSIIVLIVVGICLLVLEILILPGLIAGIIGVVLMLLGILWMYKDFGSSAGNYTSVITVIVTIFAIYYSLKSKAWQRFGLNDSLQGKTNEVDKLDLIEGDEGVALSALRPMGTVMIKDRKVEAQTNGELIQENSIVKILKVLPNKVIVKSIS